MPTLYTKDGASAVFETPEEVKAALASGEWTLPESGTVGYTTPLSGTAVQMSPEALELTPGGANYGVERGNEGFDPALQGAVHSAYSGLGDQLLGAAEGAGSVLTFGASDFALDALGADTKLREEHTVGRKLGEAAAMVGTALSPFSEGNLARLLSKTPAGMVSKLGSGGASLLGRVARTAGEGAAYGLGQAASEIALADPGMTAEQVVSELGQGALLGAALGGGGGLLGEGVRAVGAYRASRGVAAGIDFSEGAGKEAIGQLARAHRDIDEAVDVVAKEHASMLKEAHSNAEAALTKQYFDNSPMQAQLAELRYNRNELERLVASDGSLQLGAAEPLIDKMNKIALAVGDARLPPIVLDDLTEGVLVEGARAQGRQMMSLVKRADSLTTKFEKLMQETAAAQAAGKIVADPALAKAFPKAPREVLGLHPDELVKPESFKRLLNLAHSDPKKLVKDLIQLDDYYKAATAAVKGNPVAEMRVKEGIAAYKNAFDLTVPVAAQEKLSGMVTTVLGLEVGVEALVPEGPAKDFLRLAAAYKLAGGLVGRIRGARSLGRQIASAVGRRTAAGLGSGLVRELPAVRALPGALQTAAIGGGAGGAYQLYGAGEKLVSRMRGGIRAAASTQAATHAHVGAAIERAATGKPQKVRAMPGLNVLLDKLVGDPDESAKKTPQAKFKVVQERLTKYAVAPDATMNSVYEMLKPVQEVSEQLADNMETTLGVQLDYLLDKMPRDPGTMVMLGKSMWSPSDRELYEFGLHAMGVLQPLHVVDMIADGFVPPQAAQALAATNPEIFTKLQMGILQRADEVRENSTYNQRIALGLAFQIPLDPTTDPRYVAFQQDMHAQKTMKQAAGAAGETNTPEESYSDAQKLLS